MTKISLEMYQNVWLTTNVKEITVYKTLQTTYFLHFKNKVFIKEKKKLSTSKFCRTLVKGRGAGWFFATGCCTTLPPLGFDLGLNQEDILSTVSVLILDTN